MNAPIEQALANYLTAQLTGATPATCLAGTSAGNLPSGSASVVCGVKRNWDVGTLYSCPVTIRITTPAKVQGFDVTSHQALTLAVEAALIWFPTEDEVQAALNSEKETALTTAFSEIGYEFEGQCLNPQQAVEDIIATDGWQTVMPMILALKKQ